MILRNLFRRKIRTLLTVTGIAIGVAAIIGMGAMANGMDAGYSSMLFGSQADLILSQPDAFDISLSAVDEYAGEQLMTMPEVSSVSGMLEGYAQAEDEPYFFVFGHPEDSFILDRFQIISGHKMDSVEARKAQGKPVLLGSAAAEVLDKNVGDTMRLTGSVYRVIGIYQTGDAFEDSGAVLGLRDAQELLGRQRQVSLYYIQLKDPALRERFIARVERQFPDLAIGGVDEYADKQTMSDFLNAFVWAIGGLAIIIGGVGMMNSQLMSISERTREIGVLRALGWSSLRVLWMILGEALVVCLLGGALGVVLGWLALSALTRETVLFGADTSSISSSLLVQAFVVVMVLGLVGGLYPAWRAARMQPVEALRYEGGSAGKVRRLPFGGLSFQSLWQRPTRTFLTLGAISLTVGSIVALEAMVRGFTAEFSEMLTGNDTQIMLRQANVADTGFSVIDERTGEKIAAYPEVANLSGIMFTAIMLKDGGGFFVLQGYGPNDLAIERFRIVEGSPLVTNHQLIIGKMIAQALNKKVGDTLDLSGTRFRIVGIYESKISWEEMGGVVTLRDAQVFMGRPKKVSMYAVKLHDPATASSVVEKINQQFIDVHASLSGEFVNQMPDMRSMDIMIDGISLLAILVGGVGVLNTMLMAVFERTREIGVLRALGWQGRRVMGLILGESAILGVLGGLLGMAIAFGLMELIQIFPVVGGMLSPSWEWDVFARAILVALSLGIVGGLYPAYRATRLQPVEALRYE